jgi:phosphoheptose isomerase
MGPVLQSAGSAEIVEAPENISDGLRLLVASSLREGVATHERLLASCVEEIARAAQLVRETLAAGRKLLLCGNGGSAADAQHIAAELVGRFVDERAPLPAIALTVDSSILTSVGNDYGFDQVFSRQVGALGAAGDLLIAISTSGKSPNVLAACREARARGIRIVGLTGGKDPALAGACDVCIRVPSAVTARIQEAHIAIGHALCEAVDAKVERLRAPIASGFQRLHRKHLSVEEAVALRAGWRARGLKVAWTNGCFDVVHAGHVQSLTAARQHGDLLIVGVNADDSVRALKGPERPVFPIAERLAVLGALEPVDHLVVFSETTPERVLDAIRPDVHCKGADYAPPAGAPIAEAKLVESYGGRLAFLPLVPGVSTTATLERLARGKGKPGDTAPR